MNKYSDYLKEIFTEQIIFPLLIGMAFLIPLNNLAVSWLLGFIMFFWLTSGKYKLKWERLKNNWKLLFWIIGFYLFYLIGLIYSSNFKSGLFDLEVKFSIFIFPLMLFSLPQLTRLRINKILNVFVASNVLCALICLINSTRIYVSFPDPTFFFYTKLSILHHPAYQAMYAEFSIAYVFMRIVEIWNLQNKKRLWCLFSIAIFLSLYVVLLSSRIGILILSFIWCFGLIYFIVKKKTYFIGSIITGILITCFISMIFFVPVINQRFSLLFNKISGKISDNAEGSNERILIWKSAEILYMRNPLWGYGTGDVKDKLLEYYNVNNYQDIYNKRLNAHNQFLQTAVAIGTFGLIWLLTFFIIPIIKRKYRREVVFTLLVVILFINFLVESMLETQAGVEFFAFYYPLLLLNSNEK